MIRRPRHRNRWTWRRMLIDLAGVRFPWTEIAWDEIARHLQDGLFARYSRNAPAMGFA